MNQKNRRDYNNFTLMKVLEQNDPSVAMQVISDPDLDNRELASILDIGLTGKIVHETTGEPLKLSNGVMIAGLLNLMNRHVPPDKD